MFSVQPNPVVYEENTTIENRTAYTIDKCIYFMV
jgi:hypothetical protein